MRFNAHSDLEGHHAFLSASKYHWIRYDDDKLARSYVTATAAARGTELHEFAAMAIRLGQTMPRTKKTINMYVNDGIGFLMQSEVVLYYSPNAFGTVDTISFRKNVLRISDLKNGESRVSFDQLKIYVAFFCLEYLVRPSDIKIELRIYQNNEILYMEPELDEIVHIMDRIITFDRLIKRLREEQLA